MSKAWNKTRVSQKLGIDYPIIQGPFGGFSSQRLTAAVSNFGALGSFGANSVEPSAIADVIGEVRSLTTKPFAVNLWVSMEDPGAATSDAAAFHRAASHLRPHIEALGGAQPAFNPYKAIRFEDQARVLLEARVPVFSFIFGIPPQEILEEARRLGIVTIGTATTPEEAIAIEQAGIDLVVASGFEAGGHRGSFLRPAEDSLTGTISLVPQTVDAVTIPLWQQAASRMVVVSPQRLRWARKGCRWEPSSWRAKSPGHIRFIATPSSVAEQDTQGSHAASPAGWRAAFTTSCFRQ
jgi:nitronate monooxygenase